MISEKQPKRAKNNPEKQPKMTRGAIEYCREQREEIIFNRLKEHKARMDWLVHEVYSLDKAMRELRIKERDALDRKEDWKQFIFFAVLIFITFYLVTCFVDWIMS